MSEESTDSFAKFRLFIQKHKLKIGVAIVIVVVVLSVLIAYASGVFSSKKSSTSPAPSSFSDLPMTSRMGSEFPVNGLSGRYIVIGRVQYITGSFPNNINIREIEIYNSAGVKYTPASVFSTSILDDNMASYGPQLMIDGNTSISSNDRAATKPNTKNQYMLVDLGSKQNIGKIVVYNYAANGSVMNYILGCQVQVFDNNLGFVWASNVINKGETVYTYPTPIVSNPYKNILMSTPRAGSNFPINGLNARYVLIGRVQYYPGNFPNTIQIREIEIYNSNGVKYVQSSSSSNTSTNTIGIPMTAFSTSVYDENNATYGPQLLINGDTHWQRYASTKAINWYPEANAQENQYMLVDLGANQNIGKIMIHNYALDGSISNYIIGCQVQVFDNNFGFVWASNIINNGSGVFTYMYTSPSTSTPGV
jgi:hypothetical protein